jgi:lysozyme family protein
MANEQNLKPFNKMRREDAVRIQRLGADACNAKKRERKTMLESLEDLLSKPIKDKDGNERLPLSAISIRLLHNAINKGDTKAIELILAIIGESPTQKVDVTSDGKTLAPYEGLSKAEIIKRINQLQTNRKKK